MGIEVAVLAIGAGLAAASAAKQNQAIKRTKASAGKAFAIESQQEQQQARFQQSQTARDLASARGRLLASAGFGMVGEGGSQAAIERMLEIQAAENSDQIGTNSRNNQDRLTSGYQANAYQLDSGRRNIGISAAQGGLQGLQTGLVIGQGVKELMKGDE